MIANIGAWLINTQTHRQDPMGDLARDLANSDGCAVCIDPDRNPPTWNGEDIRNDLDEYQADLAAYDALDRADAEWKKTTSALDTEITNRIAAQVASTVDRRATRRAPRQQFEERRRKGLAARHANKVTNPSKEQS